MAAQTQIGIRLPEDMLEAIDVMAAELTPHGMTATRSDVIRILLWDALERRKMAVGANSQLDKDEKGS